jgi:hypothetical protein
MPNDDNDNLFHDDDALDYIMYEECEKDAGAEQKGNGKGGCLGVVILLAVPVGLFAGICRAIFTL